MTGFHGKHSGRAQTHLVEGTDPGLHVETYDGDPAIRPVVLLHGFASSAKLNWSDAGWLTVLGDAGRRAITIDLPGHGSSSAPENMDSYTPSRIRADLLQVLADAGVRPYEESERASGVDVVGYSLGARLAWEFGAAQPDIVHRMVLGGPASTDPLAEFDLPAAQRFLADGTPIADGPTADLLRMAQLVPSNDMFALMSMVQAIKTEPFRPAEAVPRMPLLLVAGDQDELAKTMPELARLSGKAELLWLPGRTHANAITSQTFKTAALEFLG